MTREDIEKDLAHYEAELQQAVNNANSISGVCQYLRIKLADVAKAEESKIVLPNGVDSAIVEKTRL